MTIHPVNPEHGLYQVDSESGPRCYTVNLQAPDGQPTCTCRWGRRDTGRCKHRDGVKLYAQHPPTAMASAALIAARLTNEQLTRFAREKEGTAAGAACWLELARRERLRASDGSNSGAKAEYSHDD